MNEMPVTWLDQLKQAYPRRSGPMSWPRVFLKVRRALMESSWETCIEGVKRYATYCQEAGIEGSSFVITPARFFEDEVYLESLKFEQAQDPKKIDAQKKEAERWERAIAASAQLEPSFYPMQQESIGAFETRIASARTRGPDHGSRTPSAGTGHAGAEGHQMLDGRIADLTARLRIAK